MAACGQATKGYFQQGSCEEDQTFLMVVWTNFLSPTFSTWLHSLLTHGWLLCPCKLGWS